MTRIAIVGGKLQGTEALYLAKKAGMETLLIDYDDRAPARGLCDTFLCCDVILKGKELIEALDSVDFILPAIENKEVLDALAELSESYGYRLAFDQAAYALSSSKLLSDRLFHENRVPAPRYYPHGKAPYIVKPSGSSGSEGVKRFDTSDSLEVFLKASLKSFSGVSPGDNVIQEYLKAFPEDWVIQEFLTGPSYSMEVIGKPGNYETYEVTQIHMDESYDCRKVTAPCAITEEQRECFRQISVKLAELVQLSGIMDIEVIDDHGTFKVLEIDARIPSQTPTVVYHTTGVNFVEELMRLCFEEEFMRLSFDGLKADAAFQKNAASQQKAFKNVTTDLKKKKFCAYEHFLIQDGNVTEHGEHIMTEGGLLRLRENFFGADEVITDYIEEGKPWRGTFINRADSEADLAGKRENMRRLLLGNNKSQKE